MRVNTLGSFLLNISFHPVSAASNDGSFIFFPDLFTFLLVKMPKFFLKFQPVFPPLFSELAVFKSLPDGTAGLIPMPAV